MTLTQESWELAVAAAARAPSPHNAQPARWWLRGNEVGLCAAATGWLSAGDPTGRDDFVALGMAWEAMTLALSRQGIRVSQPRMDTQCGDRSHTGLRPIAVGQLAAGAEEDPLASLQEHRRSYRGRFGVVSTTQQRALDECISGYTDCAMPLAESLRPAIATWYDAAAAAGLGNAAVARELYRFMRFSRRDPRWARDGLAADCMMLGGLEAWGASWLMRPGMVALLGKLGLLGLVVSEKAKVLSATRVVAIHAAQDQSPFDAGRRWYRFWLQLTAAGCAAVPMSSLADSPEYGARLLAAQPLPPGQRLINVMRIGPAPHKAAPRSARLTVAELLVTAASGTR